MKYRYYVEWLLGRYTEIPKRYPIFWNTDTDTDVGIHNTEKYRISTIKYRKYRKSVRYLPPGTENFITQCVHIICMLNLYIDVIYDLNIVDCLDSLRHCSALSSACYSIYVYSNNHNAANNDLSVILPGSLDYKFPNPESRDWKKAPGLQSLISLTRLPNIWLKYLEPYLPFSL